MRILFWRKEKEEERSSAWRILLTPLLLVAAVFWLLPKLQRDDPAEDQNQDRQQNIAAGQSWGPREGWGTQQSRAAQQSVAAQQNRASQESRAERESREEQERQSGLQRQHMRQDQIEQGPAREQPGIAKQGQDEDRQQKEMKQSQNKERGQEKTSIERENQRKSGGDKLEEIEGIGPKTAQVLRRNGITTFRQLADTSIERLNEIMDEASFRINPPDTWPEQARYAADGDWDGLKSLKDRLQAGRPNKK